MIINIHTCVVFTRVAVVDFWATIPTCTLSYSHTPHLSFTFFHFSHFSYSVHSMHRAHEANTGTGVDVNDVNGGGEALGMVIGHLLVSWRSARLVDLVLRDNLTAKELAVHVS